jgi:hypothetical protein
MTWHMRSPTFNEIRRQFGTRLALAWLMMVWRWGFAGARAARPRSAYHPRARPRRHGGLVMRAAEYAIIAVVIGGWSFWAYLIIKGALAYNR